MCILYILCPYYVTIIRIIIILFFLLLFLWLLFFLLCHYYFNYFFYYFWSCQGFASQFTEAGRRQFSSCALSDDCQVSMGASEIRRNQQASSLYQAKSTYAAERKLLYALLFILYLLFWMSDQDWAARNLDLRTAGQHTTNLWEVSCHHFKKKALLAGTWPPMAPHPCLFLLYYSHYVTGWAFSARKVRDECFQQGGHGMSVILYLLYTYYFRNKKMRFSSSSVFIAENLPIGTFTTGDWRAYN